MTELIYQVSDLPDVLSGLITTNALTGCWLWGGRRNPQGYGVVRWQKRIQMVHRVVFALLAEPIPAGLVLDHVRSRGCRHKHCCWPAHLEPVTIGENNRRAREAPSRPETHNSYGVPTIVALSELMI